jgi:hypothetical protein
LTVIEVQTTTFRLTRAEQPFMLCIDCWWRFPRGAPKGNPV